MASLFPNDPASDTPAAQIATLTGKARDALQELGRTTADTRGEALGAAAGAIRTQADAILQANARDLAQADAAGMAPAMRDRLLLDEQRVEAIAAAVETIAALPDPLGETLDRTEQPNGLQLERVRVPIGVIGIIYESRPNVTVDAAALALRAGNAVILRGGSEAARSNRALHAAFISGLAAAGLPADTVQLVPDQNRALVGAMLQAVGGIDLLVPRGGKGLVARVQEEARVPVLAHLDGVCHTFVHRAAEPEMAGAVVCNAKLRRPGICGATETLLLDALYPYSPALLAELLDAGCALRGDRRAQAFDPRIAPASPEDWDTEYLAPILSVAVVDDLDGALAHIRAHSSAHTEAIVTGDEAAAARFLAEVDSAIVMHNASTQFADGGEFGLGAEIGIATGRLHARGPVGARELTTYKWLVRGSGQVRS